MTDKAVTGRCLCNAVQFTAEPPFTHAHACHCSQCRRQSGHYVVAAGVKQENLTITGEENLTIYQSSDWARRRFCKTCGSGLFWDAGDGMVYITLGSLDDPKGLSLSAHIFVEGKGDYYEIPADGNPQFIGIDTPVNEATVEPS